MLLRKSLAAIALLIISSCAALRPAPVQTTIQDSRGAVTHLLYDGHSCTAFHIGDGKFITAAHCFGDDLGGQMKEVRMINERNFQYFPKVVKFSQQKDIVLLSSPDFKGPALVVWDNFWDGPILRGMQLVALGYPGYYDLDFIFENGYVKDIVNFQGTEMVISEEASYSGESGGPVLSTANGKVIGMVDAGVELIKWRQFPMHEHVSISLFVSAREIRAFLVQ